MFLSSFSSIQEKKVFFSGTFSSEVFGPDRPFACFGVLQPTLTTDNDGRRPMTDADADADLVAKN